jgi:competence protein ComEA
MYITRTQKYAKKRKQYQMKIKSYLQNSLLVLTCITIVALAAPAYSLVSPLNLPTVSGQSYVGTKPTLPVARKGEVIVFITGFVLTPGVHKLPAESRVADAINTAGGISAGADVSKLNLSQYVEDGLQIHVPGLVPGPQPKAKP